MHSIEGFAPVDASRADFLGDFAPLVHLDLMGLFGDTLARAPAQGPC
jgi:hypothetical protein